MARQRARVGGGIRARVVYGLAAACLLVGGASAAACSTTSSPATSSCSSDPLQCGAGQTCWVKDCTCASSGTCTASACTQFNLVCMPSSPTAMVGQNCVDSVGTVTCGDGQWCVQERNVDQGYGTCASFCDPSALGACPQGLSCVAIRVAAVTSAPVIHVCQPTGSDASFPTVDAGLPPPPVDGGVTDGAPLADSRAMDANVIISLPGSGR